MLDTLLSTLYVAGALDIGDAASTASASILSQLGGVLPVALAVGAAVIAVTIGWRFFKKIAAS